jgi:hypothetical protein
MKGRDMKYFTDDDEKKGVRDYRKNKEAYEFSLESRHLALLVVVGAIVAVLVFSVGYITGRSQALKRMNVAGGGADLVPTPLVGMDTGMDVVAEGDKPAVNFYDTLGEGEVTTEEMESYTPPGTEPETPALPPTEVATGPGPLTKPDAFYFIMVTAIKDKKKADELAASLNADGFANVYTKDVGGGMYRVGIKPYYTQEEANKALTELKTLLAKDKYRALRLEPMISQGTKD